MSSPTPAPSQTPTAIARGVVSDLQTLKAVVVNASAAQAHGAITADSRDAAVEFCLVRSALLVESLLEDLFYLCMLGGFPGSPPVVPVTTQAEVDLLLRSSTKPEPYLDWLPYKDRTLSRAGKYLLDGGPFPRLAYRRVELGALDDLTVLRNAAAHRSTKAINAFTALCAKNRYPSRRPADYLLSLRQGAPEILHMLARLERVAEGLAATTDVAAAAYLEPEDQFQHDGKSPVGTYECTTCAAVKTLTSAAPIGLCSNCGSKTKCSACGRRDVSSPPWRRLSR